MNMVELLALADRVERAVKGDRLLDTEVWLAVGGAAVETYKREFGRLPTLSPSERVNGITAYECAKRFPNNMEQIAHHWGIPKLTASLDAALTLLPDGALYRVGNDEDDIGSFKAEIISGEALRLSTAVAISAPLALCAAALRARAEVEG